MDIMQSRESGEKYRFIVPDLGYAVELPYVLIPADDGEIRIASLDLMGQIRLNRDLGRLLANALRPLLPVGPGRNIAILTAVEKALQLAQVVAEELEFDVIAIAHNKIKPHMEPSRRPVIQVGADSITSGGKFLALYERSLNILADATDGIILLDDVVSTGGTIDALTQLVEEAARFKNIEVPPILATACVATEGPVPPFEPLVSLAALPAPVRG
ncbi:adenine phosphoribosyltransferase [Desulfovibrio inopinatus]|uniref:adenine phosphoribosyltransferase n=1 Tax=Desulfovibrio inopinatus TaxID=102109 RepID=UPI0003FCCCCD|nr:adenine phosphoribosyltransferase [Desulfovibrio inopinatus]